jgi:hypothetical protein
LLNRTSLVLNESMGKTGKTPGQRLLLPSTDQCCQLLPSG